MHKVPLVCLAKIFCHSPLEMWLQSVCVRVIRPTMNSLYWVLHVGVYTYGIYIYLSLILNYSAQDLQNGLFSPSVFAWISFSADL